MANRKAKTKKTGRVAAGKPCRLTVSGSMTIQQAGQVKKRLREVIAKAATAVEIDLGEVQEGDVTALQLLCSAHRTALRENKTLRIVPSGGGSLAAVASDAGFQRESGCTVDACEDCLWLASDKGSGRL